MKAKAVSEVLEKNKSVQNLQKAAKIFTDFITNGTNKSLKSKRRCKTNKKRNKPWYNETFTNLKKKVKQLANLLQGTPKNINIINHHQKLDRAENYRNLCRKWISMLTGLEASSLARKSVFNRPQIIGWGQPHEIEILGSSSNGKMKYVNG